MVVYYYRYFPFILDEHHKPVLPIQPDPRLTAQLSKLGDMVDFIVISSNAPHLLRELIEKTTGRKVLSMIDATIEEVQRRGWQRVGVVGFGEPAVYRVALEKLGITCETLPAETGACGTNSIEGSTQ